MFTATLLRRTGTSACISALFLSALPRLQADGIYRDGVGAKSMSLGGADAAWAQDPLTSLADNPAGLGFMNGGMLSLGDTTIYPTGHFTNRVDSDGHLTDRLTTSIEGGLGTQLGNSPVRVGIGFFPEAGLNGDWRYIDPPGGTGGATSYGYQQQRSEIIVLRTAVGFSAQITSKLSIGASVGLIYNENKLQAPYVFQNEPTLPPGFKTLLNLQTSGWGADGNVGIQYRPLDNLSLGLVYKSESKIKTTGSAWGNAGAQLTALGLGAAQHTFHYDAEVDNVFPQSVSAGATWKACPKWTFSGQIDWVDWSQFNVLPVYLTGGSNLDIDSVVGSNRLQDSIPLKWKDELVYRLGVEYQVTDNLALRAGYIYGKSPVPTSTLTPLTAAITENTFTAGIGYTYGRYSIDAAYQYSLPTTRTVGLSSLAAGEYDDSSVKVSIQTFTITAGVKF
ncbi:MAG TPA: outer membrane protein transport protein [Chthoniobacteraceae bacterium]|nr:outer membrane protein transport protein [Chthoniobacteraceae bacterium]